MATEKLRIAVLFGGNTHEKEVSLESGRNIIYKLSPQKYSVTPLFVSKRFEFYAISTAQLVYNSTHEIEASLQESQKVLLHDFTTLYDFIFIGLHGGLGENGGIQGALQMLGIAYNGSGVLTSALCMNKYKTTQYLRSQGLDVPTSLLLDKHEWATSKDDVITRIHKNFTLPLIVKPHDDGCSVMVQKVTNDAELVQALQNIFSSGKTAAMIEEFITGMELTVGVLGNTHPQALPASQAISNNQILTIEEKFLPGAGENQTPAPLPQEALALVQHTMEKVYATVGCKGYARIDCFYQTPLQSPTGSDRVVTIEINTLPALTPATCLFHQAAEINVKPMAFIDKIVEFGLQEHASSNTTTPTNVLAQETSNTQHI